MSRAVSGALGTTTTAAAPSNPPGFKPQASGSDASPFSEALDRAQATSPQDTNKPAAATRSQSGTKSENSSNVRKPAAKKAVSRGEDPQLTARKKADPQTEENLASDAGQGGAESQPDQTSDQTGKPAQKKNASADGAPDETPVAVVHLQGENPVQTVQRTADSLQKDEGGSKRPPKNPIEGSGAREISSSNHASSTEAQPDASTSSEPTANERAASPPAESANTTDPSLKLGKSRLAIQPENTANASAGPSKAAAAVTALQTPSAASSAASQNPGVAPQAPGPAIPSGRATKLGVDELIAQSMIQLQPASATPAGATAVEDDSATPDTQSSSETQFSDANHPKIVSGISGRLLPNGGTMQIRLDPPELGAMQVRVEMHNGVMTASFETSNDQATRLLSHTLGGLRAALEAQGVSVQKLQVSQSPKQQQSSAGDGQKDSSQTPQDTAGQREQQRREMVRRMWQKLMGGQDPVDLVA